MQNSSKLTVAITGATGFLGQHLLEEFDHSLYRVIILTRNTEKPLRSASGAHEKRFADLTAKDSLIKALDGVDCLINIAAEVRNEKLLAITNVTGTRNLVDAVLTNKVTRVIHISSTGVTGATYSSAERSISETAECHPNNEYERTKYESEKIWMEAHSKAGFKLAILRPTNVFGEYHPFNALLNLMKTLRSKQPVFISTHSNVNYVYVKDVASIIYQCIDSKEDVGILNVGQPMPLATFFSLCLPLLKKDKKIWVLPHVFFIFAQILGVKALQVVSNNVIFSDEKRRRLFKYPIGVDKGLQRTLAFYQEKNLL